jgi:hypothetical protein
MELKQEVANVWIVVCLVLIVVMQLHCAVMKHMEPKKPEPFADTSATSIMCKQVMEGRPSLCDKVDAADAAVAAAAAAKKSTLTGSRDIPVFFQDFDYEMQQKGATISTEREGFEESNNAVDNVKPSELMDALKGY